MTADLWTYGHAPAPRGGSALGDAAETGWDLAALERFVEWAGSHPTDEIVVTTFGRLVVHANLSTGAGHAGSRDAAPRDIGSMQKAVVSAGIAQLIAEGAITLEDSVTQHAGSGWSRASKAQEDAITIRHLLSMTSGLDETLAHHVAPDTTWYYNNGGYHLVRKIVETVTGQSTQAWTSERLFEPLGMADATWYERPGQTDNTGWPISGLLATAWDLTRLGIALLSGSWAGTDLGFDRAFLDASFRQSTECNESYGLLWWVHAGRTARVIGHRSVDDFDPRFPFGGIDLDRPIAPSAPTDAVSGLGTGDQRLYLVPSRGLVVTRTGDARDPSTARGSYDEDLWRNLAPALPPDPNQNQDAT